MTTNHDDAPYLPHSNNIINSTNSNNINTRAKITPDPPPYRRSRGGNRKGDGGKKSVNQGGPKDTEADGTMKTTVGEGKEGMEGEEEEGEEKIEEEEAEEKEGKADGTRLRAC